MSNPFDQFDEKPQVNPFDQFDEKPRTFADDLVSQAKQSGRGLGLAARNTLSAVTSPVHIGASVLNKAINALAGKQVFDPNPSANFEQALTGLGFPEPQTGVDRFGQSMAQSAPAMALPATLPAQVFGNAAIAAAQAPQGQEGEQALWGAGGGLLPSAVGQAVKTGGKVLKHTLGMTTGAGGESVEQAFKAGVENNPAFVQNMRGNVEPAAVVEQAKTGLANMRQGMYDRYAHAKGGWANDPRPLKFDPIAIAADDAVKKYSFQGVPQPGAIEVAQQVQSVLSDWMKRGAQDPRFFTVEGLDSLKRHLQDLTPDYTNRTGRALVTDVVDKVKQTIAAQRPEYKAAMHDYWASSNEIDEISRSLSLGDSASVDTALRKLQSLMRNNINTNFGQRLKSAETMAAKGNENILPAVAGQALSSATPRGLQGMAATGIGGYGLGGNPAAFAMLPLQSPRLVGETAYGLGQFGGSSTAEMLAEALRRTAPSAIRERNNK